MNSKLVFHLFLLTGFLLARSPLLAQEKPRPHTLPDDEAKAWAAVEKGPQALRPPNDWQTHLPTPEETAEFQKQIRKTAASIADKASEFIERFPANENTGDARLIFVYALTYAVAAGDTDAETRINAFVSAVLADKNIPEDNRAAVLAYSGNTAFMKRARMRVFTEGMSKLQEESEAAEIESTRAALKQFPTNSLLYTMLVNFAQHSEAGRQKELATEILNTPNAPPGVKTLASHMLKGTKPYEIGKPLAMRFTALDGREVDLAKFAGKVVLVEFWSTTCGPCVSEMPTVKAAYEKLRPRGFEVVGISLDDKEAPLRHFISEKALPWPQYFDGKGWENKFAVQYGVFGIPTMWLVDKRGNLRDINARFNLEQRISRLLDE
jgi:thiol-disulfide isomerase/thioredoxin/cytochrome c556